MKRFIEKVNFGWGSRLWGCWEWTAYKNKDGYGQFGLDGKHRKAHRVSYELFVGPIPEGQVVRHKCDNPGCVNPNHLELGTHNDNMRDKVERGRAARHRGEDNGRAKLTEDRVREIRERYAEGGVMQKELAAEYGVSFGLISHIINNRKWRDVK